MRFVNKAQVKYFRLSLNIAFDKNGLQKVSQKC